MKILFVFKLLIHAQKRLEPVAGGGVFRVLEDALEDVGRRCDPTEPSKLLQVAQEVIAGQLQNGKRLILGHTFEPIEKVFQRFPSGE